MRYAVVGLFGFVLAVAVVIAVQPRWAFSLLSWAHPHVVWRVPIAEPLVALSFDDGPSPENTPRVLEILARPHAHATFFLIGERAAVHPEYLDILRRGGHEVANHYIADRPAWRASDEEFTANLLHTEDILHLTGPVKLFRPPGGKIRASQIRLAEARGYRVVLGSAYAYDAQRPPSWYVRWLVTKNLAPGAIVILHDGIRDPSRTIAALDSILADGDRRGFRFVTVGELLSS